MTFTAHLDHIADRNGNYYDLTIRHDGRPFEAVGILDATLEQGDLFDAAGRTLVGNGWRPTGNDPAFFWGSPGGNMFDGPWQSRVERVA